MTRPILNFRTLFSVQRTLYELVMPAVCKFSVVAIQIEAADVGEVGITVAEAYQIAQVSQEARIPGRAALIG